MTFFSNIKERRKYINKCRAFSKIRRRGGFPFEYEGKVCAVDAFTAYQRLVQGGTNNLQTVFNGLLKNDSMYTEAFLKTMEEVFGVKPFDGKNGMTLHEMYCVVGGYFTYLDELKKNYFNTQGSPLSTVILPQTEPSTENEKQSEEESV